MAKSGYPPYEPPENPPTRMTLTMWNDLLAKAGLPAVEPGHRWSKEDIEELQDALGDCHDWEPIPDKWSKKKYDELVEAAENPCCGYMALSYLTDGITVFSMDSDGNETGSMGAVGPFTDWSLVVTRGETIVVHLEKTAFGTESLLPAGTLGDGVEAMQECVDDLLSKHEELPAITVPSGI